MNPNLERGKRAEREVAAMLCDNLGVHCRRKLGAGRLDDVGDIDGLDNTIIQVAYWPSNALGAVRVKPLEAETQRLNAGVDFAASFIRFRGGAYRVVLLPDQFYALWREATA